MTITKNDEPEIVIEAEPEIVVGYAAPPAGAPAVYNASTATAPPGDFNQALNDDNINKPVTTTTTTTTYTVPPPAVAATQPQVVQQQGGRLPPVFGSDATGIQCPHCHANCVTRTRRHPDLVTIVAVIVLVLLFWPLFWLPFCIPACQATDHYCSSCNRKVGHRSGCS
mmetsp:Transcript_25985/g.36626  ORF Transcript_25985/g.36626 Transcript_25985/m.36626 type:complete len:168 (+) Transcript_25985:130-633(+)